MDEPLPHCDRHVKHRRTCLACRTLLAEAETAAALAALPPPWCGHCDPAGEHTPGQRRIEVDVGGRTQLAPCPDCHPSTRRSTP